MFWRTCAAALIATPALAGDLRIDVDSFAVDNGIYRVVMKVTNGTSRTLQDIYIDCVIFDESMRAIGIAKANIDHLYPGSQAYKDATLVSHQDGRFVDCRVAN